MSVWVGKCSLIARISTGVDVNGCVESLCNPIKHFGLAVVLPVAWASGLRAFPTLGFDHQLAGARRMLRNDVNAPIICGTFQNSKTQRLQMGAYSVNHIIFIKHSPFSPASF